MSSQSVSQWSIYRFRPQLLPSYTPSRLALSSDSGKCADWHDFRISPTQTASQRESTSWRRLRNPRNCRRNDLALGLGFILQSNTLSCYQAQGTETRRRPADKESVGSTFSHSWVNKKESKFRSSFLVAIIRTLTSPTRVSFGLI